MLLRVYKSVNLSVNLSAFCLNFIMPNLQKNPTILCIVQQKGVPLPPKNLTLKILSNLLTTKFLTTT